MKGRVEEGVRRAPGVAHLRHQRKLRRQRIGASGAAAVDAGAGGAAAASASRRAGCDVVVACFGHVRDARVRQARIQHVRRLVLVAAVLVAGGGARGLQLACMLRRSRSGGQQPRGRRVRRTRQREAAGAQEQQQHRRCGLAVARAVGAPHAMSSLTKHRPGAFLRAPGVSRLAWRVRRRKHVSWLRTLGAALERC